LRGATLGAYVDDVVRTAATFPRQVVLIGHSLGGLVVQRALARYTAKAAVLVAPVPAMPAVGSLAGVARQHPVDALRMMSGASLPLRPDYLFSGLSRADATRHSARCGPESALAQYQLLFHRPSRPPRGNPPMLVLATPEDRLVPLGGIRATAQRYGAELMEFPGMGHDLMLDKGWERPLDAILTWLPQALTGR
jgi:pimeloyl-ACP methyl ester carboxylesterase